MSLAVATPRRNNDIEVLRAVAILFTLAQHFTLLLPVHVPTIEKYSRHFGLWTGVDLFFVISGYVITVTLGKPLWKDEGCITRKAAYGFWIKRVFRLLPTAWLWLLLPVLLVFLLPPDDSLPAVTDVARGAVAGMLQLYNVYVPYCLEFVEGRTWCPEYMFSGHYWSLSLEEQFYIVYPLLLLALTSRHAMFAALGLAILIFFWDRPPFSLSWYFRIDGFLWGIFLALASRLYRARYYRLEPVLLHNPLLRIVVFAGLLVLLARLPASHAGVGYLGFSGTYSPYSAGMIALVCAALVWIASYDRGYLYGYSKFSPLLVTIATRSYSLYVIHLPAFALTRWLFSQQAFATTETGVLNGTALVIGVTLTWLLADLNYRYIETPIRTIGTDLARKIN